MAAGDVEVSINSLDGKSCAKFDGVNDYIKLNDASYLKKEAVSFSYWIYYDKAELSYNFCLGSSAASRLLLGRGAAGNEGKMLILDDIIDEGSSSYFGDSNTLSINAWHHVVVIVKSDGTKNVYVDNVSLGSSNGQNLTSLSGTPKIHLGALVPTAGSFLEGYMRKVLIYDKELSTDEINKLYNDFNVTDRLINRWDLSKDYNDSFGVNDLTNDGTILTIIDTSVRNAITQGRQNANDIYLIVSSAGQIVSTVIEEFPPA